MPEKYETRYCLWCGQPYQAIYKNKIYDRQLCHMEAHRHRQMYYSELTVTEFKKMVVDLLKENQHINPKHPLNRIKKETEKTINTYQEASKNE